MLTVSGSGEYWEHVIRCFFSLHYLLLQECYMKIGNKHEVRWHKAVSMHSLHWQLWLGSCVAAVSWWLSWGMAGLGKS